MSDARRISLPEISNKSNEVCKELSVISEDHQNDLCNDQIVQDSVNTSYENTKSCRRRRQKLKSSKRRKKSDHWTKKYNRRGLSGRNSNARINHARGDPVRRRSAKHDHECSTLPPLIVPPSMRVGLSANNSESMETDEEHRDISTHQDSPYFYQQHYQSNGQVPTFLPSIRYCPQQATDSSLGTSSPHILPRLDVDRFRQSPSVHSFSDRSFDGTPQYYYQDYRQQSSSSIVSQEIGHVGGLLSPSSDISEEELVQDRNPVTWLQSSEGKAGSQSGRDYKDIECLCWEKQDKLEKQNGKVPFKHRHNGASPNVTHNSF